MENNFCDRERMEINYLKECMDNFSSNRALSRPYQQDSVSSPQKNMMSGWTEAFLPAGTDI